jgi:hypothetical protein
MKSSYAVVWSTPEGIGSGRLEPRPHGLELQGRESRVSIPIERVTGASIVRDHAQRLRGLPVLALRGADGGTVRIASLEGPAVLHELLEYVQRFGLRAVAV